MHKWHSFIVPGYWYLHTLLIYRDCVHADMKCKILIVLSLLYFLSKKLAFSALTLFLGHQEVHQVCKNWVMRWWHGYLFDASDMYMVQLMPLPSHHLLLHLNPDRFNLSDASLPRLSWNRGH